MTRLYWYAFLWYVFRWPSVTLVDFDGEVNFRLVRRKRAYPYAARMGLGVSYVTLCDNGVTRGTCYVDHWEPLYPSQPTKSLVIRESR